MSICDYVKNRIGTCEKCIFQFEWGYKRIFALGSPKTYCSYILVKGNISVNNAAVAVAGATANNTNKKVIFKNYTPFTNCISKINNTQIDNTDNINIVMPMYNLIEYSDNYSKTSASL